MPAATAPITPMSTFLEFLPFIIFLLVLGILIALVRRAVAPRNNDSRSAEEQLGSGSKFERPEIPQDLLGYGLDLDGGRATESAKPTPMSASPQQPVPDPGTTDT